ncbi:enoyl-CoA hydratase/isomerase family protein [Microbacterium sp. P5_E9]
MSDEGVLLEVEGAVALVTIDRPAKLNSVTQEMSDRLVEVIEALNDDDAVRVVILTGAGERAFCAGSDIRTLDKYATPWDFRNRTDYCDAIRACRKPVIAAVNGYAFGGGLETALSCDIRLSSSTATFAAPEITLGWIGGGGMSAFLAASIGPSNAAVMLMTGQPIDAATALRWGLVSEVVEPDDLLIRARALAEVIASRPPIAAETAKANLHAAANMPQEAAIRYERDLQTVTFATEDAHEGRAAFAEKRPGVFHRR